MAISMRFIYCPNCGTIVKYAIEGWFCKICSVYILFDNLSPLEK